MGYRGSWGQDPRFSTTGGTHGTTAGGTGRVSEGLESGMGGKLGKVLGVGWKMYSGGLRME